MKKFTRILAVVLALVLVAGVVPASAASGDLSLTKTKKTIFADGCKGTTAEGKVAKYYDFAGIKKLVKNFNSKTMDIKLESSDTSVVATDDKKDRVNAVKPGKATVTVSVYDKKSSELLFSGKITVTVKKNATTSTLLIDGIKDGDSFKEGDSVKVTLTRKSGTDTDLRRLVSSGDGVSIEEAGTRKYKVTFKKAGTFTLTAESYMSEKYSGATASKSVSVTVAEAKKEEEKKEEEKKEEKKEEEKKSEEAKLTVVQTVTNQFKLSGSVITSTLKKEDIKIHYVIANTDVPHSGLIDKITVSEGSAVVDMLADFAQGITYYVTVGGEEASFTTPTVSATDPLKAIKAIDFKKHQANVGEITDLEFVFFDENNVDITSLVKNYALSSLSVTVVSGEQNGFLSGTTITMYEKGKTTSIKAVLTIGYDSVTSKPIEVVKEGIVMCVEKQLPVVQAVYFTLSNDGDSVYYKKGDKENKVVCVGDGDYVLEVLFQYSDQSVKTPAEIGAIAKSETEMVAMIGGQGSSGGSYIIPNMTGQALIRFYVDNKVVPGADVAFSVQEARKATRVIATPDKNTLNIGVPDDSIEITAKVLDQYNTEMKNVPLYITQTEASLKNVSASFGSFDAKGKLLIQSSQCSIIGSLPSYPVIANVTNGGNLSCPISFNVKSVPYDSTKLASYEGEVILEGNKDANGQVVIDTTLKQGNQEFEDTVAYIRFSSNDGTGKYAVKETAGVLLSTAPTTSLKPSDLNTTAGNSVVAMTIQYKPDNGQQVFITSAANIDVSEFVIGFTPVKSGSKLAKGIYTLMGYVITFTDSSTIIKPLGAKQITVKESTLGGTITQKKETYAAAGNMEQRVAEFFDFYLEGAKLDPTMIKSVEHNDSSANNSSYIVSVTFALSNSVYGSFDLKIPVNRLIKFSA